MSALPAMKPVESSQIAAIGHDAETQKLFVQFRRSEDVYVYPGFTAQEHASFVNAPSIGKHFGANIKHRPFEKTTPGMATAERVNAVEHSGGKLELVPKTQPEVVAATALEHLPAVVEYERKSADLSEQAKSITVTDVASQQEAEQVLLSVAAARTAIQQTWKPMKDAAHKAHKVICDQEKTLDAPLALAESHLKSQIGSYVRIEREKAQAEERRQAEENRQRADEEAARESQRLAIEDAIALEEEGDQAGAEAVLAAPVPVVPRYIPTMPVRPEVSRTAGVGHSIVVKFVIENADIVPREYMVIDESAVRKVVSALGMKTKIPGVRVYEDVQVATARSARG